MSNSIAKNIQRFFVLFRPILIILLCLVLAVLIVKGNGNQFYNITIFQDISIINILSVLFGFSLTVITLIYTSYEKIMKILSKKEVDDAEMMVMQISNELKQDIKLIFIMLVITIFFISVRGIDIPIVTWNYNYISKNQFIEIIKVFGLFLALYSVWDLIKSVLQLIDLNYFKLK